MIFLISLIFICKSINEPPSSLINEIKSVEKYKGIATMTVKNFWVKIIVIDIKIRPNGYNKNIIESKNQSSQLVAIY